MGGNTIQLFNDEEKHYYASYSTTGFEIKEFTSIIKEEMKHAPLRNWNNGWSKEYRDKYIKRLNVVQAAIIGYERYRKINVITNE
jgi:hypothetical protein